MKKTFLIITIIGVCLFVVGGAIFAIGMTGIGWDIKALSTVDYVTECATFEAAAVNSIVIDVSTADVLVVPADGQEITVEYYIAKDKKGNVVSQAVPRLADGLLSCKDEVISRSFLNFSFGNDKKVVVKVPADKEVALSVDVSTGDVTIGAVGIESRLTSLRVKSTTGSIRLIGLTMCDQDFVVERSTGDLEIAGEIVCGGDMHIKSTTGKTAIDAPISASHIDCECTTGDLSCSRPITFEELRVEVTTGDVSIRAAGAKELYTYTYETSTGDSNWPSFALGAKRIFIRTTTGDIRLTFAD